MMESFEPIAFQTADKPNLPTEHIDYSVNIDKDTMEQERGPLCGEEREEKQSELAEFVSKDEDLQSDIKSCTDKMKLQQKQHNDLEEKRQQNVELTMITLEDDTTVQALDDTTLQGFEDIFSKPKKGRPTRYDAYPEKEADRTYMEITISALSGTKQTAVEPVFTRLELGICYLQILKYCCETIQGILTICEQYLPDVSPLLDDHFTSIVSANSVQIFITDEFLHLFGDDRNEKTSCMSARDVMESINQINEFSLIVIGSALPESVVEALKTSDIRNAAVLIVGDIEELPVLPNVFFSKTKSKEIIKDADCLLERCAFGILKQVHLNLQRFQKSYTFDEHDRGSLQDLYDMINASFKRSNIPKAEWPDIQEGNYEYPVDIDKAVDVIMDTPAIIGYVKKRGILQIYIEASAAEIEMEEIIRSQLKKYEVTKYQFLRRKTKKLCCSGDIVSDGRGTLGGFVKKENLLTISDRASAPVPMASTHTDTLVALVSRHVVQGSDRLTVGRNRREIGRILQINLDETIDILPVDVYDACRRLCDTNFKTKHGVRMTLTKLRRIQGLADLLGAQVHIWSERSAPGLGVLLRHDLRNRNSMKIIVGDRQGRPPFAKEGDSGAMVCYYDPHDGGMLYAVGMIVEIMEPDGGRQNREYTAQILDYALQNLSIKNECEFKFIEGD